MVGDISHGNQPAASEPDYLDARETLDIRDRGQDCRLQIRRFPVEVKVLYSVGATNERIVAARFKQGSNCIVALQVGTLHNQSKLINRHIFSNYITSANYAYQSASAVILIFSAPL